MDKYKIKLNAKAYCDLDGIYTLRAYRNACPCEAGEQLRCSTRYNYISKNLQSPENAKGQTNRLWKSLKTLDTFPQSHQESTTGKYVEKGYRQLLTDNYITIFRIDELKKIVTVVTIQYQGRNL